MSRITLLVLLVLAAGLGYLTWTTLEDQKLDPDATALSRRLFPGVERDQVTAFRLDHIERNTALRLEKSETGLWTIVDPISAEADPSMIKQLLDRVADLRGSEVEPLQEEADRRKFLETTQLLPPRAEFEVEWQQDGTPKSRTIEIGGVDLDARSLLVRDPASGRVLRTLRTLDTILERGVSEFRNPLLLGLNPERVVELHRTGTESFEAKRFGIELHAYQDNDGWVAASPQTSDLHPGPMGLLLTNVSRLRAKSWLPRADVEEVNASTLFAEPVLRLDARYSNEEQHVVEVTVNSRGRWLARNPADPLSIANIDESTAFRLSVPFELLADRRLLRVPMSVVQRVKIERAPGQGDPLLLERQANSWRVIGADGTDQPADRVGVRDLLGKLERFEFYDLNSDPSWPAEAVVGAFQFEGAGETWRIEIGGPAPLEERQPNGEILVLDTPGVSVRRRGEETVFVAEPELLDLLLDPEPGDFIDLDRVRIDELQVRSIELSAEDQSDRWTRSERGRWTRAGEDDEAFEILALLDSLFTLRAEAVIAPGLTIASPVRVVAEGEDGVLASYAIGEVMLEDGPRAALIEDGRSWLLPALRTSMHEQLLRLVRSN